MIITIAIIAWWIAGSLSFCYWWTKDYDLDMRLLPVAIFIGVVGPLAFFIGWFFHGNISTRVILKKRQ